MKAMNKKSVIKHAKAPLKYLGQGYTSEVSVLIGF